MTAATAHQVEKVQEGEAGPDQPKIMEVEPAEQNDNPEAEKEPEPPVPAWQVPEEHEELFQRFVRAVYLPFFIKYKLWIMAVWLIIWILSVVFGPQFLSLTKPGLDNPAGSDSSKAQEVFDANYPGSGSQPPAVIVFSTTTLPSVVTNDTRTACIALQNWAKNQKYIASVTTYYDLMANPMTAILAPGVVSSDNKTMIADLSWTSTAKDDEVNDVIDDLLPYVKSLSGSGITVGTTGLMPMFREMTVATTVSFELIDAVVLPIAIVILGLRLWSYRHMAVVLINFASCLLLAFAILAGFAKGGVTINPFAPSIMQSLGIAVCFDYSLFFLTRFREERIDSFKSKEDAVFITLVSSGHIVVLSGFTLVATFVLLLFFPQNFLQSVGLSCACIVLTAILAVMTITPTLLLWCNCFSHFDPCPSRRSICCCRLPEEDPADVSKRKWEEEEARKEDLRITKGTSMEELSEDTGFLGWREMERRSFLFRFAWAITGRWSKWITLAISIGAFIPIAIQILHLNASSDTGLVFLQGSDTLNTFGIMQASFGAGQLESYQLILTTGQKQGIVTPNYFTVENKIIHDLIAQESQFIGPKTVTGLSYFQGMDLDYTTAMGFLSPLSPAYNSSIAMAYRVLVASKMNADQSTMLVNMQTLINPQSDKMVDFIRSVRSYIKSFQSPVSGFSVQLYLYGGYSSTMDVQDALYKLVPVEIAVVLLIVVIILAISFASVTLVLRLLFTILYTLGLTYGLMVLVYQPGPSQDSFMKLNPILSASTGIYWIIPIMSFSILVGFALDYDIFLIVRFIEFRRLGWSDRAAICLAIEKTGGIITTAGLIMMVSFAGLLIPKTIVLNQYGFSLFIGVTIDTFIMRPIISPAIITAFGDWRCTRVNWWPRRMPDHAYGSAEEEVTGLREGRWAPKIEGHFTL